MSTLPFAFHYRIGRVAALTSALALALAAIAALALLPAPAQASSEFGFLPGAEGFSVQATELNGEAAAQAGSHPYQLTTHIGFAEAPESPGQPGVPFPAGDLKDMRLQLPAGLVGNPTVVSQCTLAQFNAPRSSPWEASLSGESCPDASQVGTVAIRTSLAGGATRTFGVFNLVPPPGYAVELGFAPFGQPVAFGAQVRGEGSEYGLSAEIRNFPQALSVDGLTLTLWGTPWAISHDTQRGNCLNEADPEEAWGKCSVGPPRSFHREAFLTMPTSCTGPLPYTLEADSWQAQGSWVDDSIRSADAEGNPVGLGGCGRLSLETFAWGQPTTDRASSASGFEFDLEVHQEGLREPGGLAGSEIRDAVASLPAGVTINPSVAAGLGVCTPAQYAAETAGSPPGAGCPDDSKIGDFTVQSPLVAQTIGGSLYLAKPFENPFGSLIAVYLVAKDPARGILVKVAGRLTPDPSSGQLTATFAGLPQLPYSHLRIFLREGQRAPLASPAACGSYSLSMTLTPWLDPEARLHHSSEFQIDRGVPFPPPGPPPFAPGALQGSVNPQAGAYSPYYLHLTRTDTEQEITSYSAVLPPGLTAKLAGLRECPDASLAAAAARSGAEELAAPSCPADSEIGRTMVGYGLGGVLDYAPGKLYLAGPYHGSPLSIAAVDSALVGPFDLGTIVVRSAIDIDPATARVSIDSQASDPIPHIVDGIPLHLRDIRVYIDRPGFTLDPTSCEPFAAVSTLTGSSPPFADPRAASASHANLYQATDCSGLGFKPSLSFRLKGPPRRGAYPSLRAVVRERPGDADIAAARVTLPPAEYLAQNHIRDVCTPRQYAAQACPTSAIYGHARAFTPLLSSPLEGPLYLAFRSLSHAPMALPELLVMLHGEHGLQAELAGRIDSGPGGGMRASFAGLPDVPASKFVLRLPGGRRGLLQNSTNLCAARSYARGRLVAQDNAVEPLRTPIGAGCGRRGHEKRSHRHRRAGRRG
jgi:hypothetical protein